MSQTTAIKILGKEYKLKTDVDPQQLQDIAAYVERTLVEARRSAPDSHDAAILAALNIAGELVQARQLPGLPRQRIHALIDRVESG